MKPIIVPNNNSTKAFSGVLVIVAIIAGVYAMVEPMNQQISYINERVSELKTELQQHEAIEGHPKALERHAQAAERFKEVETQFDGLREVVKLSQERDQARIKKLEVWWRWWNENVPGLDATQNQEIKNLERIVFGGKQKWELQ